MRTRRPVLLLLALLTLAVLVAIPVLAASPSQAPGQGSGKPDKPPKEKAAKVDKVPVTLTGTVAVTTDADGEATYTLRSGGTTYTLEAGPRWFFGDDYPLKPFVGTSVTITGEHAQGSTEVDVETVDGTALREPGKPPWAGGWKVVGERHPGWSQAKADRFKAKFGDCFPPGQCKDKGPKATEAPTP